MAFGRALKTGEKLIDLYREFSYSLVTFARTYHDLFQICLMQRDIRGAKKYMKNALKYEMMLYDGLPDVEEYGDIEQFKMLAHDPKRHPVYMMSFF